VALREVKERLTGASDLSNVSRITDVGINLKTQMRHCFYRSRGHLRTAEKKSRMETTA
jgi:hypothetical protein